MKLVLYSGGNLKDNKHLDDALLSLANNKKSPIMTYIPSSQGEDPCYFQEWKKHFKKNYNLKNIYSLSLRSMSEENIDRAFSGDIIFLSGGNTFAFLYNLRKKGWLDKLRKFVDRGGVLSGMSAGAILMSPDIMMASVPSYDRDINNLAIKDLNSLSLINFEFSPHYEVMECADLELIEYSIKTQKTIYGCPDGSGIVVHGENIQFLGDMVKFQNGIKVEIGPTLS